MSNRVEVTVNVTNNTVEVSSADVTNVVEVSAAGDGTLVSIDESAASNTVEVVDNQSIDYRVLEIEQGSTTNLTVVQNVESTVIEFGGTETTSEVQYLEDLTNVTSGATTGQVLTFDGNVWNAATPASGVQSNWNETNPLSLSFIVNKPTLFDGAYSSLTGIPSSFTPSSHTHVISDVTGLQTALNNAANVQSDWNEANASSDAFILNKPALFNGSYNSLTNVPATFTPSAHTHAIGDVTNLQTALDAKLEDITTESIGDLSDVTIAGVNTGDILQYNAGTWEPTTPAGGALTANIVVTDAAGAVQVGDTLTAGTSFEDVFNAIFVSYQEPVMSISGWSSSSNREHGYTFSDTQFTLSFTNPTNINTADTGLAAFTDTYIANGVDSPITAVTTGSQTVNFSRTGQLLVTNVNPAGASGTASSRAGAAQLTVSGFSDTNGDAIGAKAASSTVKFRYFVVDNPDRVDYGSLNNTNGQALVTDVANIDGSSGVGLIESGLITSPTSLGFNGQTVSDYVYWIYPSCISVSQMLNPSGTPLYSGDTTGSTATAVIYIGEFNLTNQYSKSVTMTVLRSKNPGAIGTGSYTVS